MHVGRLVQWKRVDLLLKALAILRPKLPHAHLHIIGAGPLEDELKAMTQDMGLSDCVAFVGGVYETEDLGRRLLESSVYVLAGMGGLSLNDAMAFGKPVICSVCDGTEKALVRDGKNGFFFREGDVEDLAEKIEAVLSNDLLSKQMGEESTRIIREEVNVDTVVKNYLTAFNKTAHRD